MSRLRVDLDHTLANSFKDYHVRGFDYVCLRRSPEKTLKLYFFSGDVRALPEVVSPHDHRYDFHTQIVTGRSENVIYRRVAEGGRVYNRHEYRTPLLGGTGFTWAGEERLSELYRDAYRQCQHYRMRADGIHTIRLLTDDTVLMLLQGPDVVDGPTSTWIAGDRPPSLDGLYSRMTADEVRERLGRVAHVLDAIDLE